MKHLLTKTGLLAALGLGTLGAHAQTVDGTRDASYPAALAVQTATTGFGNETSGQQEQAGGSELDNIHAQIVGTDLYLFIGGNLSSNYNKIVLFIDSKNGGQNVLRGDNPSVDFNGLNSLAGLQFDAGFTSDYFIGMGSGGNPLAVYTNVAETPTGGGGNGDYAGGGVGRTQTIDLDPTAAVLNGQISIDNSNTGGVSDVAVGTPGTVSTGIEYRIPLAALGTSVGGGNIRISAFITSPDFTYLSNQVLGGLPAGTGNLAGPGGVNFASIAGLQYVTVANAPATPSIALSPGTLDFFNVAAGSSATRTVNIANSGTASLNVTGITSSNLAFTVTPITATVAAGASVDVTVTFAPTAGGSQTGSLSFASNDPSTPSVTVSVAGTGVAAGQVVLDGTVDAGLYTQKALQTTLTGFGDNYSELDGAYTRVDGTDLYVTITGNLQNNANKLVLFFDADPVAGQSTYLASNPTTDNSAALAGLQFDRGFAPESFVAINMAGTNLYASYVPMNGTGSGTVNLSPTSHSTTQSLTFSGTQIGELSLNNSNAGGVTDVAVGTPSAVTTGIELRIPLSVLGASITSTTPIHIMALLAGDDYSYLSNQTLGGLPAGTGNLGSLGANNATDFLAFPGNQFFTAQRGDVTVANTRNLAGDYQNITIAATGNVSVYSPLNVAGTLSDQGILQFQDKTDAVVTGSGTTTITGNLVVASPDGISAAPAATGNIQTSGRNFGSGASYTYGNLSGVAMSTGTGLPTTVAGLAVGTAANLALAQPVAVSGTLALVSTGNLNTNNQALTLLSNAAGTALVANLGPGVVNGAATVQRYIAPNLNAGPGYRHYSAPVAGSTVGDLQTSGFVPVVNPAYNTSATPGAVTPFPTVYGYDESRISTSPATAFTAFNKGWFSPGSTGGALEPGHGYTVNIPASEKVDFVGTLNNGPVVRSLPRTVSTDGGWALVGNPYPAPLDYSLVAPGDRTGLDAAVYVFESNAQYTGTYRTYLPGSPGIGNPIIASGQGFFVRTTTVGSTGTLTFRNAQRVIDAATANIFHRTADNRPVVEITLGAAGQTADRLTIYADAQATVGLDAQYDAVKMPNTTGLNLAVVAVGTELAINGLPVLAPAVALPLAVRVAGAGTYTLNAATISNLPAGLPVYLHDAATGQQIDLQQQPTYSFTVSAAQAATLGTGRFTLAFAPAGALAIHASLEASGVQVYPNPAHGAATLLVPAVAGATELHTGLYNTLGQLVRSYPTTALPAAGLRTLLDVSGVAAGLYTVRLAVGNTTVSKKLAVN